MPHLIHARFVCLCVALTTLVGATTSRALDTNLPPSGNFDLPAWKITLPDQTEIKEQELSSGFESPDEFYTDPVTGGMVFKCPNNGETGGSTYPRCELREMLRAGNTSIPTTGIGLNNWVFSTSSEANQQASGGVDGTMTATLTVDHVSTTGTASKVGRVIVGQIHASSDEPCRLYYRKLPGNSKGSIYFAHEPTTGSEQWYEIIGSRSDSAPDPADGVALGEEWSYEIKVVGNTLAVTIVRAGKPDVVETVDMSGSGFANDWMYFKAGCYNQNNEGDASQYAQVTFYALTHTHGTSGNQPPSFSSDPINETSATEDVPYSSTIADDASDPEADPMTFSKVSGPAWLSVATNGVLSGTPGSGDVGANVFTVQVAATGGSNTATLNITVNAASSAGMVTNTIVDDSFTDANRANTGSLQADWWSSTSSSGNSIEVYTGQLGLVTGTSGRGNHGTFASQPLAVGDALIATLTFTTPATVGDNKSAALRFGLFDTTGHLPGLEADLSASSSSPNTNYNNLNGYMMDLDVVTGSENLTLRERDNPDSGRLLATTDDYASLGSGGNSYTFLANTTYTVEMSVTRQAVDEVQMMGSLYQGAILLSTHTESDTSATATEFGMLGMHANSSTFGSTTTHGPFEDNGITFSNIKVERVTTAPAAPPTLDINRSDGNVVLSWPTNGNAGFDLEATSGMSAPSWSPAGSPTVVGDQHQVTVPATDSEGYYRLNKP
jgi:hypothetical protein